MPNQFSPDADDRSSEKKRSQQRLLLLLLLLMGLFAYLYFFTGLIRPRPEQAAEQPSQQIAPVAVVKQPLPPRQQTMSTATVATGAAAREGGQPPAAAAPQTPAAKPAPGAAAPAAKPAPAAQPAKPAPAAQQKAAKPAAPAANGAKAAKPAAAQAAKPAATAGTKAAAKPAATAKGEKGSAAKAGKPQAKGVARSYALEVKDDLAQSEIGTVTAKLKKAGLGNVVQTRTQKGEEMHRLYLADFASRDEATEQLQRLKDVAPNAFMLKENGRYAVYAGSFLREGKAAVEQDRLYDRGVRLLLKTATAQVPVVRLRAGSFADQASAQKAAANLKKSGLTAQVVKVGK